MSAGLLILSPSNGRLHLKQQQRNGRLLQEAVHPSQISRRFLSSHKKPTMMWMKSYSECFFSDSPVAVAA
jgi:hypothetical protein